MNAVLLSLFLISATMDPTAPPQQAHDEIVVTASALPEPAESTPAALTVITRKEIDERLARDVADVLRDVPGISVSRTGSQGRATSLFTRGSNSTHTLVLWNGIEINNPYFAGYDWGRFSTAGVDRVEVVRGPFSSLYGSDAVAGVVNVITDPLRSSIAGVAESGGRGLRNGRLEGTYAGGGHVVSGALERRTDEGFARNDDFAQSSGSFLWRWTAASGFSIGAAARATSYDLGVPTNLNAAGTALVPSLARRERGSERQIAIPISHAVGALSLEATLSESRRRDDFDDPEDPFGMVWSKTDSVARRVRATARYATAAAGTIVAGGEIGRARVNDATNFGPNLDGSRRSDGSLFVEDRYSRAIGGARLELSAGVRHDRFDTFGSQTSPRAAAAIVAGANKLRAGFGEAFRAPSIGELYFPWSGNRSLAPERSRSAEVGYDRLFGSEGQLSVTLFRAMYRDLIVFDNATYAFANVGRAESRGVELGASRNEGPFYASISYTYLDKPLPRRPRNAGSLLAGFRRGAVDANVHVTRSGQRSDILPVLPFSAVVDRAYTTVDVDLQVTRDRFTPFVKIENATDTRYEQVRGYASPRRRAIVGVRFAM